MTWLLVGLGGAVGTVLRYALSVLSIQWWGVGWPYGTWLVNVLGSLALGAIVEGLEGQQWLGVDLRLVLGTGALGGFTTYSSFNLETLRLADSGQLGRALAYAGGTVLICLMAGVAGMAMGRALR